MNSKLIIAKLEKQYPGKTIVKLPEKNPTEIICEVEPYTSHNGWSLAIAYIDESVPHYHLKSVETYELLEGALTLYVENTPTILKKGQSFTVHPNKIHWTKGNGAVVKVYSEPGWEPKDHILVKEGAK